jgi:hypothetical protein
MMFNNRHPGLWSIILLVLLVVVTACSPPGDASGCDENTLRSLRLPLPPSAANVQEMCSPGVAPGNAQYKATFTMSPDDLATFQEVTEIVDWSPDASGAVTWANEAAGASSLLFGTYSDGIFLREVLIDTSNPQPYNVYLFNAYVD